MIKIFVAKSHDGLTMDVVMALDEELAKAYWLGKGVVPGHIISFSNNILINHSTGVVPIVSTEKKMIMNASCTKEKECFVII